MTGASPLSRLFLAALPHERKAVLLSFLFNFLLLGSYYILRPVRDTMATVFGVAQLQTLFTGTFIVVLLASPVFAWVASKITLSRLLPGIFWFLLACLAIFYALFQAAPDSRWVAAAYYWWLSAINLFLISIFWTFMADLFAPDQATRLFAFIAAGGSIGAIAGPLVTRLFVDLVGISGLLLMAGGGFLLAILIIHLLMREKERMRLLDGHTQQTSLDHSLPGNPFKGFALLFRSPYLLNQAAYMLLMTWVATIFYFLQADLIAKQFPGVEARAAAFADVDLYVNIASALILIFGLGRILQWFGVTASLVLTPLLMAGACAAIMLAPSLTLVQFGRAMQRVTLYAIARPSREVLFTVVDQQEKYKAKNVIDTTVYRLGDLSSAWMLSGLRALGFGMAGAMGFGVAVSALWGVVAIALGRRYGALKHDRAE